MQTDTVTVGIEADRLTIYVDEVRYSLEDEYPEDAANELKRFIEHITSGTIKVEIEEVY